MSFIVWGKTANSELWLVWLKSLHEWQSGDLRIGDGGGGVKFGVGGERWRVVGADIILRLGDLGDVPVVTAAAEASDGLITAEHLRHARAALDRLTGPCRGGGYA